MGVGPKISTGGAYGSWSINPVNPDPYRFQVLRVEAFCTNGRPYYVSEIHYPNCTNYEGRKILLTVWDPRLRSMLDPHFSDDNTLLGRFVPNALGWEMACRTARSMP